MPTIELISIGCQKIPDFPRYRTFDIMVESRLQSHRGLIQSVFDTLTGVIVHLKNKGMKGPWCFAGQLMDWTEAAEEQARGEDEEAHEIVGCNLDATCSVFVPHDSVLSFRPRVRSEIIDLLQRMLDASPTRRITFSTDYQCGGKRREHGECTLTEFLDAHDRRMLVYNALYNITADAVITPEMQRYRLPTAGCLRRLLRRRILRR